MAVLETYALVKFLKKEQGYEKVSQTIEKGSLVAEATLYELFYVITRDYQSQGQPLEESLAQARKIIDSLLVYLRRENLTEAMMREAVFFKIKYSKYNLSHFDCLALATARVLKQPLFSGEKGLMQVKEVEILG